MRIRRLVLGGHRRRHARRGSKASGGGSLILTIVILGLLSAAASRVGWPAVIVALLVIGVIVLRFLIRRAKLSTPKAQDLNDTLQYVGAMSGSQFEIFVAQVLRAMGYKTSVLGGSGDQGVDIIALSQDGKVAVQCKNYQKPVGNKPVQEVFAGAKHYACKHAWVVAPAGYTRGAYELARSVGVLLFDANSMRTWIKRIDEAEKKAMEEQQIA
jgi:HJR/Mrr/RecB family endonuclease